MISKKRIAELTELARKNKLDFFPIVFEEVTVETMNNIGAYGLPTRARHWRYGRSYDHQKTYGKMGYSKVYEMITNNDPSYAFVADTNSEAQNLLITAHCFGHSDFFKNNIAFQGSDRGMVRHASEHASRIDRYIHEHGLDAVERLMDAAFALEGHIDIHRGLYRKPYGHRAIRMRTRKKGEFDDLLVRERRSSIVREVINAKMPPRPERDLLWFFINYAPLEDWERDVLDIVREEAFYFHPQGTTKIMNEGWAVYWHAELLYQYEGITADEHIDFARTHEKVVQPGPFYNINPYFLGFRLFRDIEKRWDKLYEEGESSITGREKIFEVRAEEDDISFLRNYVTDEFVEELGLFTFGQLDEEDARTRGTKDTFYEIKDRVRDEVVEALIRPRFNGGVPDIAVVDASSEKLCLKHNSEHMGTLNFRYAEKTLEYIWELWTSPVELSCRDDDGNEVTLCFDEAGFYTTSETEELEELEELELDSID